MGVECSERNCSAGAGCGNRLISESSKQNKHLVAVRPCGRKGQGVFAVHPIGAEVCVCVYEGQLISTDEAEKRSRMAADHYYLMQVRGSCILLV